MIESVKKVSKKWGGKFKVSYSEDWKKPIKKYKSKGVKLVHMTMYGEPLKKVMPKIRKEENLMIVVGSAKVPGQLYIVSDYNVSVGNQPHSEVSALSIFLHEYYKGKELEKDFPKKAVKTIHKGHKIV